MSYGRSPYYIYRDFDDNIVFYGAGVNPNLPDPENLGAYVPFDAIAQLIVSIMWRGPEAMNEFIRRGLELRPELAERVSELEDQT